MNRVRDLIERIKLLLFRRAEEQATAEELEFHVAMETELRRRNGLSADEARRQALASLGGVERTKEEVREARGTRGVTDGAGDFRQAFRQLRQRPAFAAIAILTIAVGIGATTAVFSEFDAVVLRSLPYPEPSRLVRLYKADKKTPDERSILTPVHAYEYRKRLTKVQVAAMNLYDLTGADIGSGDDVERIRTEIVTGNYFAVLGTAPALGRTFTTAEETGVNDDNAPGVPVAIISHELWHRRFHDDGSIVGKPILMNGLPTTIVGVAPARFVDPLAGPGVQAWVPLNMTPGTDPSNANNHYLSAIGRLAPGATIEQAQAELDNVSRQLQEEYASRAATVIGRLYPLQDDLVRNARSSLLLIVGAVAVMLLLVCVNIATLLLVRGSERARELAVRSALGARRGRLLQQLMAECLVLAGTGTLLALPIARILMSLIVALSGRSITHLDQLSLDARVLAFSVAAAFASALIFGLLPAWRAANADPATVLRRQSRSATGDRGQGRLRTALVTAQVALAFLLLTGAGVLLSSLRALQSVPLGVSSTNVLTFQVHLPEARYDSIGRKQFHERFDAALAAIPGVKATGATSRLPVDGPYNDWGMQLLTGPRVGPKTGNVNAQQRIVTPGFFRAAGIKLIDGRLFDMTAVPPRPQFVISKKAAELFYPKTSAIGQQIETAGQTGEVIGVVDDVATNPEGDTRQTVYRLHSLFAGDRNWSLFQMVATTGPTAAIVPAVRRALAAIDPQLVMDQTSSLAEIIDAGSAQRTFTLDMVLGFALTAVLLAALGVFGVLSYAVRLRSGEFSIRLALGATPGSIRLGVLRAAAFVTGVGIVLGGLGAVAFSKAMRAMVFRVSPLDPVVLVSAALLMATIAVAAAWLPARRATSVDPRSVLQ